MSTIWNKNWKRAMVAVLVGWMTLATTGCDRQEGPLEEAGESADEAVENAGDKLEDAGDELEDRFDRAN